MLADAIRDKTDESHIPSLCYKTKDKVVCNEIGGICADIDAYGLPTVHSENACFIDGNTLVYGDPQLDTRSYEVVASLRLPLYLLVLLLCEFATAIPEGYKLCAYAVGRKCDRRAQTRKADMQKARFCSLLR